MPNFTQEFRSTDVGMPAVSGTAGAWLGALDACLVNGGATQSVTSITEAGTTYSAVIPADVSLEDKDWLVIAGASPAGANGTFQIALVNSTHFSYTGPGGLGAITGSITYKRAPLGWSKPFGTVSNVAAYLAAAGITGMPQFYVRVDDNYAGAGTVQQAAARGYETMSDQNTGTGPFPTVAQQANGLCWRKSSAADATARAWVLIGDGATFKFMINSDTSVSTGRCLNGFGGFDSFRPGDAYNCLISGTSSFNVANPGTTTSGLHYGATPGALFAAQTGIYVARGAAQTGGAVAMQCVNRNALSANVVGATGCVNYPGPDGALWVDKLWLYESAYLPRGRPRGLYLHCHNTVPFASEFDTSNNVAGLPGVTLLNLLHASGQALYDRYGPW